MYSSGGVMRQGNRRVGLRLPESVIVRLRALAPDGMPLGTQCKIMILAAIDESERAAAELVASGAVSSGSAS